MSVDSIGARLSHILETLLPGVTWVAAAKSCTPEEVGANFVRISTVDIRSLAGTTVASEVRSC